MTQKVRMAIAGLGFGAEFIPIYQAHPDAELVAVCQRTEATLNEVADHFGVPARFASYDEMLQEPDIDAVHINTPIPNHAEQTIAALRAGKHVACTVPMATTIEECRAIVEAVRESGRNYMMMETVVYSREFLHVRDLVQNGTIGRIQFLRGAHFQEMAGWPGYWEGLPPMHYATHAVSPVLSIAGALAESVVCLGSGRISPALTSKYGSPFAVESALITLRDSPVGAEIARSLFETAHEYVESFTVFGDKASFEWADTRLGTRPARRRDPQARRRSRFRPPSARGDRPVHDARGLRRRGEPAPLIHPGQWSRRLASTPRARVRPQHRRATQTHDRRSNGGELDVGWYLRPRIGHERRNARDDPGLRKGCRMTVLRLWGAVRLGSLR
jgi:predicted dehydrogenase